MKIDKEEWKSMVRKSSDISLADLHMRDIVGHANLERGEASSVEHPKHYNRGKYEVIDVIEDWGLDFHCGNAIKYISRHKHKEKPKQDIEKAIWYLQRYMEKM
jgi:hypothetical protein